LILSNSDSCFGYVLKLPTSPPTMEKPREVIQVSLSCSLVRHECAWIIYKGVRNCARDEGRPLGVGLQEQAPNRLKLRW
jgi:hypothetical protein